MPRKSGTSESGEPKRNAPVDGNKRDYFQKLGLDAASVEDRCRRKAALTRAYSLRTFEIEHYWKRATYFWAFQVAIFAAFGLTKANDVSRWEPIPLFVSGLGVLTALANILSAKGSKFWQENWEAHIDILEDEFEGRPHKTIWLRDGKESYSVSRLNLALGYAFFVFWVAVFVAMVCATLPPVSWGLNPKSWNVRIAWIALALGGVGCGVWSLFRQTTKLRRHQSKWILRESEVWGGDV